MNEAGNDPLGWTLTLTQPLRQCHSRASLGDD